MFIPFLIAVSITQQTPPAFEVASIHRHDKPIGVMKDFKISGSRVTFGGYTIPALIEEAWDLRGGWQLSLGAQSREDDLRTVNYTVAARAPGETPLSRAQARKMLQLLLAERFRLAVHRETKPLPVYAMAIGKNGMKLTPGTGDEECSMRGSVVPGGQRYAFKNCPVGMLVDQLSRGIVDRPVLDKTGLTGKYDFIYTAMPAFMRRNESDIENLSPYTSVQELGFTLQKQTAQIEIIAVDHVENPTAN